MNDENLSFTGVLGDSIGRVGRHWLFFLGVGLANILLYLPGTYLVSHMATVTPDGLGTTMALIYGVNFLHALVMCLIYGTIISFVYQIYHRPDPQVGEAVRLAVRRWPGLVWTMVVRWFWLGLGFMLLIIPGAIWGYRQMLCWAVTTIEGISGPAALRRAQDLMKADPPTYGIVFAIWMLSTLLVVGPSLALSYPSLTMSMEARTAIHWGLSLLGWFGYGVYYFAMVRIYAYLRERLDRTPADEGVGFNRFSEL